MATKAKAVPVSTAVVRAKANLPAAVTAAFADELAEVKNRIAAPAGNWIKVEGKMFILPDGRRMPELDAVIVDFICANNFYENDYVEGEHDSPACFAISFNPEGMTPSASIAEPVCDNCTSCPNKVWGSHRNGRGAKACDDNRNYVVMEVVDGKPVLYLMKASKTAVKAFDGYVAEVASAAKRPLRGVMTHIFFDTESKYPSQRWSMTGMADNDTIMLAQGALDNARHMLNVEPSRKTEAAEETKKPAKKAAGKR